MSNPLLADISSWQPAVIDWQAYAAWSRAGDGVARVIMRASQGIGVPDTHFDAYWLGATQVGIDCIGIYHYAYPGLHPGDAGAQAEADYFLSVVGSRLRSGDFLMLDYEEAAGTAGWAIAFLTRLQARQAGILPRIYASYNYVLQKLQDVNLTPFPLVLADWTFDPNSRPTAPAPWVSYEYLQFSDREPVPGIGVCDANVYIGGSMVPQGPFQFYTVGYEIPKGTTVQQIEQAYGLLHSDLLTINPVLLNYNPTLPGAIDGMQIKLPGYPQVAKATPMLALSKDSITCTCV